MKTYPVTDSERKKRAIEHFQRYPDDYVRYIHGIEPDAHQVDLLRAIAKPSARVCVVGANGMGKDAAVGWLPEWFLYCFGGRKGYEALVPTTSASGRQIDTLWREINGWSGSSKNAKAFDLLVKELRLRYVEDENGGRIAGDLNKALGFKAANAITMESFHAPHLLYIMTEARGCEDWAYLAMYKACTGLDNRIVIQSVPGEEVGEFFKIASGLRNNEGQKWEILYWPAAKKIWECSLCAIQINHGGICEKCNNELTSRYIPTSRLVTQESINEKLAYGEESEWFQGPVLANFLKGSSRALISLSEYMAAESRYGGEDGIIEGLPDVLGIDAAWVGQNQTVFCHRKGPVLWRFQRFQGQRTNVTAGLVEQWLVAHPHGVAVIEGIGVSAGVIDLVIANGLGDRLMIIHPGSPPVGTPQELEQFKDRRSQLYYYLARRFKDGTLAVREKNLPLGGQLTGIRAQIRGDSKYEVEGKREMLKRMPSPDDADAAMLSMAGSPEMGKIALMSDLVAAGNRTEYGDW